jgi:hypothetical protein
MPGPFSRIALAAPAAPPIKRRCSVTQDVVGYRRCPRQYGEVNVHKYAPAHQTQLYFGTVLHQVLDRFHSHYHGLLDARTKGTLPDGGGVLPDSVIDAFLTVADAAARTRTAVPPPPSDIVRYFLEVENSLKSQGIRAIQRDQRLKAIRVLQYFNALEGPTLYPRVADTEHRLQADQASFILHGVVDLLVQGPASTAADCEIWDYKGTSRLGMTPADIQTYTFQMQVYARLYELKHGSLPRRVVLYLLNELDGPTCPTTRPVNALLDIDASNGLDPSDIAHAMAEFSTTVGMIERDRQTDMWMPAAVGCISEKDCAICDLRWDCPTPNGGTGVAPRYP